MWSGGRRQAIWRSRDGPHSAVGAEVEPQWPAGIWAAGSDQLLASLAAGHDWGIWNLGTNPPVREGVCLCEMVGFQGPLTVEENFLNDQELPQGQLG